MKLQRLFVLPPLAVAAIIFVAQPSSAAPLFSLGDAGSFAILNYGTGSEVERAPAGNFAVGQDAIEEVGGSGLVVSGQTMMVSPTGTLSVDGNTCTGESTCTGSGSVVKKIARVSSTQTAIQNMYSTAAGLVSTPNQTVSSLAGTTLNLGSNYNHVLDVTGSLSLSAGNALTVNGDNTNYVVIDIESGGGLTGSAGGSIKLNGISPDHLLFNYICTGTGGACTSISDSGSNDIGFNGSFAGAGIILAPDRNITEDAPSGSWTGRLFSDTNSTSRFFSDPVLVETEPDFVPDPAILGLCAAGLALFGFYLYRVLAQRKKPAA